MLNAKSQLVNANVVPKLVEFLSFVGKYVNGLAIYLFNPPLHLALFQNDH